MPKRLSAVQHSRFRQDINPTPDAQQGFMRNTPSGFWYLYDIADSITRPASSRVTFMQMSEGRCQEDVSPVEKPLSRLRVDADWL